MELLNLGPDFMVVGNLNVEEMQTECAVTLTKMRWGRMGQGVDHLTDAQIAKEELNMSEEEKESEEAAKAAEDEMRDVISTDGREVCMGRQRATDMKNNRHVRMPAPASARLEAMYNTRADVWQQEFQKYRKAGCNEAGDQNESNLTPGQAIALKRLQRKVNKLEIIVLEADKGKRFVVVDEATYVAMSRDHIMKDRVVEPEDVTIAQRIMSMTAKALTTILGVGKDQSSKNQARCHDNSGSGAEDAPILKLLPKVHKVPTPSGHPQSRPVVAAASGLTSRAGDIISDFLGPIIHLETPRLEDKSTEEVVSQLEEAQEEIVKAGSESVMVGSLDVKGAISIVGPGGGG